MKDLSWKDILGYYKPCSQDELNDFIKKGYHLVCCDASYKNFSGTCSVEIKNGGKTKKIKNHSFTAKGPNEAELKSLLFAIRDCLNIKSLKKVLFVNDNYYAISLISKNFISRQENIKKVMEKIEKELKKVKFEYEFALVRSKLNKNVDKSAKKFLTKSEVKIKKNIYNRLEKVRKAKDRCAGLSCKKEGEKFIVKSSNGNDQYTVELDPLSCTCPYWNRKWEEKKQKIIDTRALPCKHICKACDNAKIDVIELFHNQIFRRT